MLGFMKSHLGANILLKGAQVAARDARDRLEVLEELNAPVAGIVLGLVFDVVATLTVPSAHADILRNDIDAIGDAKGVAKAGSRQLTRSCVSALSVSKRPMMICLEKYFSQLKLGKSFDSSERLPKKG
jgi:hypothetical protein